LLSCFNFPLKKTERKITDLITISLKHPVVALDIEIRLSKWDTGWIHRMYMSNIELLGVLVTDQLVEQFPSLSITFYRYPWRTFVNKHILSVNILPMWFIAWLFVWHLEYWWNTIHLTSNNNQLINIISVWIQNTVQLCLGHALWLY
jgi:hypothetical protein